MEQQKGNDEKRKMKPSLQYGRYFILILGISLFSFGLLLMFFMPTIMEFKIREVSEFPWKFIIYNKHK